MFSGEVKETKKSKYILIANRRFYLKTKTNNDSNNNNKLIK